MQEVGVEKDQSLVIFSRIAKGKASLRRNFGIDSNEVRGGVMQRPVEVVVSLHYRGGSKSKGPKVLRL